MHYWSPIKIIQIHWNLFCWSIVIFIIKYKILYLSFAVLETEANVWSFNSSLLKKLMPCMIKETWRNLQNALNKNLEMKVMSDFLKYFLFLSKSETIIINYIISICTFRILCYSTSTWYFCHHGKISTHPQFFGGMDCINKKQIIFLKISNNSLTWYYSFNFQSLIVGDVIYSQVLGKSAAGLLLKVLCNCSDSPRVVTELGVKVYWLT